MGTIAKCPHCGKHMVIETGIKIDVNIQKLVLEEKTDGDGDVRSAKKSSGNPSSGN